MNIKRIKDIIQEYLPPSKVKVFEKFLDELPDNNLQHIFSFAFFYTLKKNEDVFRKTGAPNVVHPLMITANAIHYKLDFVSICASLLHDVIEDEISTKTSSTLYPNREERYAKRPPLRRQTFRRFTEEFYSIFDKQRLKENKKMIDEIILLVDILSQHRHKTPDYYRYIETSFCAKEYPKAAMQKAILIKYLDRLDNIITMDTRLKKMINKKVKLELDIIKELEAENIKVDYKKYTQSQLSLLIDHSFSGGNRLNQLWKNTYLIITGRLAYNKHKLYKKSDVAHLIEKELIEKTRNILTDHKNDLRLYLSEKVTNKWDQHAQEYADLGGIYGKTKANFSCMEKKPFMIYNTTVETFSTLLLKNNKEFKKLQVSKLTQYQYLTLIDIMLRHFAQDDTFVCDLTTYVTKTASRKTETPTQAEYICLTKES
jgi:hypothetical protein